MMESAAKKDLRAAVFGASGAIGEAIVAHLEQDPTYARIYAGARQPLGAIGSRTTPFIFDLRDETTIANAAARIGADAPLDLVVVATGVLHRGDALKPEKTWRDYSESNFTEAFAINAIGPALIAKHFLPLLARNRHAAFACLSARVGSIGDNRLGGWVSYRASKAALNQIMRTSAIELARRNPHALCVALHPGTVASALSAPFASNASGHRLFDPPTAARQLLSVLAGLTPADSGGFFAWDGASVPY